jgi:multiple sugar transport system permease protein
MTRTLKNTVARPLIIYIPLVILVILVSIPLMWMLITALKSETDVLNRAYRYFSPAVTFDNFIYVWLRGNFFTYFKNSLYVTVVTIPIVVLLSVANAYALSRFTFKGKHIFMLLLICTQFIPVVMILVPRFILFKEMGVINTPYAIIISMVASSVPFQTLLLRGFVGSIPIEVDEAAMVDGAGRFRILFTLIPPIILPGISVVVAMVFINSWNEFISAFTFITSQKNFTVSVGLRYLIGEYSVEYGALCAAGIIAVLPPVLLFAYLQKHLISGMNMGAVKG